jgi:transposase InsO family protein
VRFGWIRDHRAEFDTRRMCRALQVSRSGFYAWRDRAPSRRQNRREELAIKIRHAHLQNRQVYGSPRVCKALLASGEKVCENTVARIMRQQRIRARIRRKYVPRTTDGRHAYKPASNRLNRQFAAERPNRKWVTDITYVPTNEGWLYLAAVLDLCSRRIVGWSMADHMKTRLVSNALEMAIEQRRPDPGLLHHSDRGVQYACDDYQQLLKRNGLECSMSGKGNCYDNAAMESFWATLKTELVHQQNYATRQEAQMSIFEYIEAFYNRVRLHSTLGYVSPEQFEASQQ